MLSILFFSPCPSSLDMTCLNSLYRESVITTMAMPSHVFLFGVTASRNAFISTQTLENILVTNLLNFFGLLIFRYVNIS